MNMATARYHETTTVEVVAHGAPNPDQIAVTVVSVTSDRVTTARTSKVAVTQPGTTMVVKAVSVMTAQLTMMPAKSVTAPGAAVAPVMPRANMNADTGMNGFRAHGRGQRQCNSQQAGGRQALDQSFHDAHREVFSSLMRIVQSSG